MSAPLAERGRLGVAFGLAHAGRSEPVRLDSTASVLRCLDILVAARHAAAPLRVVVPWGGEAGPHIDPPIVGALVACGVRVRIARSGAEALADAGGGPLVVLEPRVAEAPPPACATPSVVLASFGADAACADAAATLAAAGTPAAVISLVEPTASPALVDAARACGRVVVVSRDGAEPVVQSLLEPAFWWFESPPFVASPSPASIVAAARAALEF